MTIFTNDFRVHLRNVDLNHAFDLFDFYVN